MNVNNIKNNFTSLEQMASQIGANKPVTTTRQMSRGKGVSKTTERSFGDILKSKQAVEETGTLKFSKHANQRLASRNIDLSSAQLARLESGANKAREKGIKESLVMVDDLAFIVNVPNNTVITAMDQKQASENIFTNIDGAVIM